MQGQKLKMLGLLHNMERNECGNRLINLGGSKTCTLRIRLSGNTQQFSVSGIGLLQEKAQPNLEQCCYKQVGRRTAQKTRKVSQLNYNTIQTH